ncbi:MAG: hypothetical protein QQM50_06555 [Dehalococcoides mccartyi]|nr:hypothetical protein [Dehalococcoides mccartyi]MDP4280189.1 hypothetical protein [Dehalococcoides mccartyi]
MTAMEKAAEVRKLYNLQVYPVDVEEIARKEGLIITTWPLLPPVEEVKVGCNIGLRDGLSNVWRRWDIAHALGHHLLLHRGNQLVLGEKYERNKNEKQTTLRLISLCLTRSFRN